MVSFRVLTGAVCTLLILLANPVPTFAEPAAPGAHFPYPEKLTYRVEWRLIDAGAATVQLLRDNGPNGWDFNLRIESAGVVSRLYRVVDSYKVNADRRFCLGSALLDGQEGKRHSITKMTVDSAHRKLFSEERDLIKNTSASKAFDVAPCTHEIVGALASLRTLNLQPGKSTTVPIADGKKFAQVRIEAETKENVTVGGKSYAATRYEAFLFDNILYRRRGRLLFWISDDGDHLPLQFRLLLGFPIGTVTVWLQKQEK
ncbi:MAG: DUF3108 domain-containing protein [Acidobacteriota bacterium]|nr:DUF3108 domain-containing protein [Acidobacteriota bacterium]